MCGWAVSVSPWGFPGDLDLPWPAWAGEAACRPAWLQPRSVGVTFSFRARLHSFPLQPSRRPFQRPCSCCVSCKISASQVQEKVIKATNISSGWCVLHQAECDRVERIQALEEDTGSSFILLCTSCVIHAKSPSPSGLQFPPKMECIMSAILELGERLRLERV